MTLKAGVILINKNNICLIYRDYYNDYSFPKGHLESGESLIECAIRETEEETKRKVKLISEEPFYIEEYKTPKGEDCKCYYYIGYDDGVSDNKSLETHEVVWTNYQDVKSVLSYKNMWLDIKDKVGEFIHD